MALVLSAEILLCDRFRLDRRRGSLRDQKSSASVSIGSRALDVLGVLIEQPGALVSKDEIMNAVWPGIAVEESNLTVQISALRRILDAGEPHGSCIQTVPGRGYRFVGTVSPIEPQLPAAAPPNRRLAAIFAADVAGYSRLMGADEEGTLNRLMVHRKQLVDPKIEQHRGRIVKTTGDGMLVEFSSVVDAVRCAVEVQRAIFDRNAETPDDKRITFRIGVNLGDVIAEADDIYGDGVNIAARLEALAEPGGICISRTVRDHVGDRLPYQFGDMGEQSVKNIAQPVHAYAMSAEAVSATPLAAAPVRPADIAPPPHAALPPVPVPRWPLARRRIAIMSAVAGIVVLLLAAGGVWWQWPLSTAPLTVTASASAPAIPATTPRLSIVVLPFANLSDDRDQQYLADGLTEDLTTDLSNVAGTFVISRNSAFTYKGKSVDARQVGRELGVRYVLEGSVRRSANQIRVNAQLIDAESNAHLWAERFDRDAADLFELGNEITGQIANSLGATLIRAEADRPTENPDAQDYILRGRATEWGSRETYAEAVRLYELALALDPQSVEAQSRLAQRLLGSALDGLSDTREADITRAEALIAQALATSPRNPLVRYAKGQLLRTQRRCAEAIPEYELALAANPNWATALSHIGRCKTYLGLLEEAIAAQQKALRLSPREPSIESFYYRIGEAHLLQSHIHEAILWLEKARSANPALPIPRSHLAAAYALNGELDRAATELAEVRKLSGNLSGNFSSIARRRATSDLVAAPAIRSLAETTYLAGLRKAGMPEE